MRDIDTIKEIFLTEEDPEELEYNKRKISEWEQSLIHHEAFAHWKDHDVTQQIIKQAKDAYKDMGISLAINRNLTEVQRYSLWARQDACLFLLTLTNKDSQSIIEQIHKEIKLAIDATN